MRNDSTPQVETREIADSDLDNVSGGVLGVAVGQTVSTAESLLPVSQVNGIASEATGINTAGVTGLAGL
ncbi:type A2 lantipeptide [Streptomyces sp. NPDC004647]|uniref:type A2 lantipeptide n=1 Tax=Streptomyces sp. NPDC004647 TaxID=3154671 RepID=UPI0033B0690C